MSQRPSDTAEIPEPEPVGLYVKVTPLFCSMKDSPRAPMTFSIDVEPSVETVPVVFSEQPMAESAVTDAMSASAIMFLIFILKYLLHFLIFYLPYLWYIYIIP